MMITEKGPQDHRAQNSPLHLQQRIHHSLVEVYANAYLCTACRLAGSDGGTTDLLAVHTSEDPLSILSNQPDCNASEGHNPRALDYLDHRLMVTEDVRSLLAVLAPWLAEQQPFLLVSALTCADQKEKQA